MSDAISVIELATGSNSTTSFGSGVNKALNVEAESVFEIKESVVNFRNWASRKEKTSKAVLDLEKYGAQTLSNGGDLEDGSVDATFTVIDNQSLIQFGSSTFPISVGFKLTPKLLRQSRTDPEAFMARYRRKIAFDMARKEDVYIASIVGSDSTNVVYGGAATQKSELGTGSIMTVELFESMVDTMQENEYEPTDFIAPSKVVGQLRRDARLSNNADFSVAIQENGSTVTRVGDVEVHMVRGTTIIPEDNSKTQAFMIDRSSAYGIVDFLKNEGDNPITMSVGEPDPTLAGANYHRLLGEAELECKILDGNALVIANITKA